MGILLAVEQFFFLKLQESQIINQVLFVRLVICSEIFILICPYLTIPFSEEKKRLHRIRAIYFCTWQRGIRNPVKKARWHFMRK